jgi:hypothetical protein
VTVHVLPSVVATATYPYRLEHAINEALAGYSEGPYVPFWTVTRTSGTRLVNLKNYAIAFVCQRSCW